MIDSWISAGNDREAYVTTPTIPAKLTVWMHVNRRGYKEYGVYVFGGEVMHLKNWTVI